MPLLISLDNVENSMMTTQMFLILSAIFCWKCANSLSKKVQVSCRWYLLPSSYLSHSVTLWFFSCSTQVCILLQTSGNTGASLACIFKAVRLRWIRMLIADASKMFVPGVAFMTRCPLLSALFMYVCMCLPLRVLHRARASEEWQLYPIAVSRPA